MKNLNAELLAISPNKVEWAAKTVEEQGYSFPVLSDQGLQAASDYNLDYEVDEETREALRGFLKTELSTYNGDAGWQLPVPATYILDSNRVIQWVYANVDYKKRPSGARLVDLIKTLKRN